MTIPNSQAISETSRLLVNDDNGNAQEETWINRLRRPHLLWMIPFSITLSTIMTSIQAPIVQFILELSCQEFKERSRNIDDCNIPEIQIIASNYVMWYTTLSHIAVTISIGYLSTLSDYLGRKFVFRLSTAGLILSIGNILIVAHYWRIIGIKFLYIGSIIEGLLGGVIAINTACHAYLSDCTSSENRSVAFGFMHASAFCGMAIGPIVGGLIVNATGSILSIFYIALCALIVFLFVVSFIVPESVPSSILNQNHSTTPPTSIKHILSPLTILTQRPTEIDEGDRSSSWRGRNVLYILAVIYFIYRVSQAAQNEIINLYTKYKFNWTSLENGYFLSLQAFTRFLALLILIPLLRLIRSHYQSTYARSLDIWMMRGGLIMEIIGFTLFAVAVNPDWFYFACVINSLATITSPAMRSLFTTYVLPSQAGQVLGAISVLESIGSILSPLWMNKLYNWGIMNSISEIVFWANAGFFMASFVLSSFIW